MFGAIRKLGNFGQGYVNFGEPITLQNFLNERAPNWRTELADDPEQKPSWLTPAVNVLANRVMTNINDAAAASSVTLTSLVLLATDQNALERSLLERQLDLYLTLLKKVPYTTYTSVAEGDGKHLVQQGLELNKFVVCADPLGEIVSIEASQAVSMTYYRNNIIHLFIVPSLIASCLTHNEQIPRQQVVSIVADFYPLLKAELFMGIKDVPAYVNQVLDFFIEQGLVVETDTLTVVPEHTSQLLLLASSVSETLQRYAIIFNLLANRPKMERSELESESHLLAQRLGALHGITAPEFYDKKLYGTLSVKLKELGYLADNQDKSNINRIRDQANSLLRPSVKQTIVASVTAEHTV